ncbi:hypothetical protein [Mesorhizobium sp.]|uniref:hypothetical protein n=1 Tax=Mesorhizobium sp. TaxID=1871066 RepID=UPI000FE78C45|nr:hypothetical protein [Mesorhizobium sp.]RWB66938.1 MAG: hypothetical protein EOQ49_27100 [Mesorhizobium sp.]RWB87638.1 MAG: hypothetical protein EOQ52_15655 [Mesorhizobium sp.]RWE38113.1 MAG: hypothetical protein EOS77_00480 [Mesorhizobium sp.]
MANSKSLSALDVEIIRSALHTEIRERNLPESEWLVHAAKLIQEFTGSHTVDPKLLNWIVRNEKPQR